MMKLPEDGRINKLEDTLYSRSHPHAYRDTREAMHEHEVPAEASKPEAASWQGHSELSDLIKKREEADMHRERKLFKKILWGAIVFFVLALGVSAWLYFGGGNSVSSQNIDITVSGPTTIPGGSELSLDVDVQNKNNADLQNASLAIEYPAGSKVSGDLSTDLARQNISLGTVPEHGELHKTISAVLFGEKSSIQTIKITLTYSIAGSSATFNKEKDYDLSLASSPLIVTADYPTGVKSNEPFDITLHATSNSADTLHNVLVSVQYPFGYTFQSGTPSPLSGNTIFPLGDFTAGDTKTVTIHGVLSGEDKDERTFLFSLGVGKSATALSIDTILSNLSESITLQKPAIGLTLSLNGKTDNPYVSHAGEGIDVTVRWQNNTPNRLLNGVITATLSGSTLNRSSVVTLGGGFYRSSDNTIIWNSAGNPSLVSIDPGASGYVEFRFSPNSNISSTASNQDIGLSLNFAGNVILADNTPQVISALASQTVKLGSELGFTGAATRSQGPFANTGPFPPQAEKPSTYTIVWTLTDSLNDVNTAVVTATLPPYVSWNGLTSPKGETVTYDPVTNTVTWSAGTVSGGSGFGKPARTADFQVTVTPSLSQVGTAPVILNGMSVSAKDAFTGSALSLSRDALTTYINNDPTFKGGDEQVVK